MGSLNLQIIEYIPAMRRYASVVVLNKLVADQLLKDVLEESIHQFSKKNLKGLKLKLFHLLVSKLTAKSFDNNGVRDLTAAALHELLGENTRHDIDAQGLVAGLSHLNQQEREVLILAGLEGFRYVDIGEMLDVSLATVMSRLHSAREKMRDTLFGSNFTVGLDYV
ncbi:MAG: RNA polymerase sigma factor [Thiohalomonadales bacterium]